MAQRLAFSVNSLQTPKKTHLANEDRTCWVYKPKTSQHSGKTCQEDVIQYVSLSEEKCSIISRDLCSSVGQNKCHMHRLSRNIYSLDFDLNSNYNLSSIFRCQNHVSKMTITVDMGV